MRRALLFLILLLPVVALPADIITVQITVTNGVVGNTNTFTLNGSTRTATNSVTASPGTLIRETNSVPYFTTNLFIQIGAYPVSGSHIPYYYASNVVRILGLPGETMTASIAGGWGAIEYLTNTIGSPTFTVRVPYTVEDATNQTTIASLLIEYLNLSTNALSGTASAGSNYLTLATPQTAAGIKRWTGTNYVSLQHVGSQRVTNSLAFSGLITLVTNGSWYGGTIARAASISGTLGSVTNGLWTNGIALSLTATNLMAPGTGTSSIAIGGAGEPATATATRSQAIGPGADATGVNAVADGYESEASADNTTAKGSFSVAAAAGATAYGTAAAAYAPGSLALAEGAVVAAPHTNSAAIANGAITTKAHQVMLGAATHTVTVPGVFEAAATTNAFLRGTNVFSAASIAYRRADHSSLVNGDNAGVILGTNHWVRIVAGPTAAFTIHGLANGQDGLTYKLSNYTGFPMTIANNSGTEPAAGNRILTGKGANLSVTNYPGAVELIYDSSAAKWTLLNYTD